MCVRFFLSSPLSFFQMLTLSLYEMPRCALRDKGARKIRLEKLRAMNTEGLLYSAHYPAPAAYWTDELRQKRNSDIVKLQLLNLLRPNMLKKVVGVIDKQTGERKFVDQTVIQTFNNKLRLNPQILTKGIARRRKRFESRLIKELDDWTVLCNDVNRIIAKFAIMD